MISTSEPLEFVPRGRLVVDEHTGPIDNAYSQSNVPFEHVLLQRMQNVNISTNADEKNESWTIREIYDDLNDNKLLEWQLIDPTESQLKRQAKHNDKCKQQQPQPKQTIYPCYENYMYQFVVNTEEELYVRKNTAVWCKGLCGDIMPISMPKVCLTCETPIKFAFFCNTSFIRSKRCNPDLDNLRKEDKDLTVIGLIDQSSLRIYCSNGEDFLTNLEFPVSNVWNTEYGIILEKVASNSVVQNQSISMPRIFTLSHPYAEICPLLHKSSTNSISYFTDMDYTIIYSVHNSNLIFMYDNKIGKHFMAKLRKLNEEEIQYVSAQNGTPINVTAGNNSVHRGTAGCSFSQNSMKYSTTTNMPRNSTTHLGRSSLGLNANNYSNHISRFLSSATSFGNSSIGNLNRSSLTTPLNKLQSTIDKHSISVRDLRKIGESQPAKPIAPEFCLEHFWSENTYGNNRSVGDIAIKAFIHHDLVGQSLLCYLLPRSMKLQFVNLINYGDGDKLQLSAITSNIQAKDAITLNRMKMIAVLDPSGSLLLYTNTTLISKVHVALPTHMQPSAIRSSLMNSTNAIGKSPDASFPRRSSLLPSIQKSNSDHSFDDELHLLSPVQPLHSQHLNRNNVCISLRDPACNRLTLVYSSGKMYRLTLPLINDTQLVSRCFLGFQHILTKEEYLALLTKWYCARNPPGSLDYSIEQEWRVFEKVLYDLIGYSSGPGSGQNDSLTYSNTPFNAEEPKKRRKDMEKYCGSDDDWKFLLSVVGESNILPNSVLTKRTIKKSRLCHIDTNAILFKKIPAIFYCLHLIYEDFKLDNTMHNVLFNMAMCLHQFAIDMQLSTFSLHYTLDYPVLLYRTEKYCLLTEEHGSQMQYKELLQMHVPSIYQQLVYILKGIEYAPYPYADDLNDFSRNILQIVSLIMHGAKKIKNWIKYLEFPDSVRATFKKRPKRFIATDVSRSEQLIQLLLTMKISRADIDNFPVALHLIIAECLEHSRLSPPIGCSSEAYELILRSELVEHTKIDDYEKKNKNPQYMNINVEDSLSQRCSPQRNKAADSDADIPDGMENFDTKLFSLRFPDDMRIAEVRRLLSSSEPVLIDIVQSPGTSDHEFIEEQERQLFAVCARTMTLPMGRAMFTLRTAVPHPTESMPIPKLCLTGKEPIKGASVEMQQIEFPPNMNLWPNFHNGVAAGLKISKIANDINSTWIVYNKPKGQTEPATEHAGFLLALGLNGHLKNLSFMSVYEYLVKCDEMVSLGLLLGISAAHRGTMHNKATKLLSVHIESLLPATALELDIPQNLQVASLMGIGLLYQGSAKRHIAEVLLQEVGRPPGPEMENSIERESYALTAGLALGLVTLGHGESSAGLRDLQLPDTLHYYMVGGHKRPLTGSQKEKYKLPSFQVREGEMVNIDITAPGATLALGLMFFNTSNRAIAEWMDPPNTRYQLDLVRPDLLMLRIIARGLIMWSQIKPTEKWLNDQFPESLSFNLETGSQTTGTNTNVDHEAITQAYCNIIAGSAFCMGLKYAGTENIEAFTTLRRSLKMFLDFPNKYVGEYAGRSTVESCLVMILISVSLVYAGTGDLEILRFIRYLRSRIGTQNTHVTYGSHMAIHMSLGLLFLGAGRYTISRSPEAVAALVCAFFPKFPIHSNDNRYHLQAFRHLYILAVEPRLFLPRDIDTKQLCLANISVMKIGSKELQKLPMAPCILPDLKTLQKVVVDDPNYWPVSFERGRNWHLLVKALEYTACIDIKKRTGCLSHLEDPDRLKSILAQTLTREQYICWEIDSETFERFSNDPFVMSYTDRLIFDDKEADTIPTREQNMNRILKMLIYNAIVKDKMHVLPIYLSLFDTLHRIENIPRTDDIWQMRLIEAYIETTSNSNCTTEYKLFSDELVNGHVQKTIYFVECWLKELCVNIKEYMKSLTLNSAIVSELNELQIEQLIAVIVYYNIPPNVLNMVDLSGSVHYLRYIYEFKKLNLDVNTVFGMVRIMIENDILEKSKSS